MVSAEVRLQLCWVVACVGKESSHKKEKDVGDP